MSRREAPQGRTAGLRTPPEADKLATASSKPSNRRRPSVLPCAGFDRALGVRHHAEHIAGVVEDPGDVARRAVDLAGVAERDPAFAFEPVERLGIGLVIAVVVGDRDRDLLARRIGAGEDRLAVLDLQADRAADEVQARRCASARRAAAPPRSAPGSRCRRRAPARRVPAASATARMIGERAAIAPERR